MIKLIQLKADQQIIKQKIREQNKIAHINFVKQNKPFLIFLDILMALTVLMNFGALAITDTLTTQTFVAEAKEAGVEVIAIELNPSMAKAHDIPTVEDLNLPPAELKQRQIEISRTLMRFIRQAGYWAFILFGYIFSRRNVKEHITMGCLIMMVCIYFCFCGYDFWHDVGLLVGRMWGCG